MANPAALLEAGPAELGDHIGRLLDREPPASLRPLAKGWSDLTFRAEWPEFAAAVRVRRSVGIVRNLLLDVQSQFELLEVLHDAGVPVPRPLAFGPFSPLESAILVTEWVPGYSPDPWAKAAREFFEKVGDGDGGRTFVDNLVAIHAIRPDDCNDSAHLREAMRARTLSQELAEYNAILERGSCRNYDGLLRDALRWVEANLIEVDGAVVRLAHGDYQPGNLIMDSTSGTVLAVLDWEMSRFVDYHYDLAWIGNALNRTGSQRWSYLVRPEAFIDRYQEQSGNQIDEVRWRFWTRFHHLRHMMVFCSAQSSGQDPSEVDLRMVRGRSNLSRLALMLCDAFDY